MVIHQSLYCQSNFFSIVSYVKPINFLLILEPSSYVVHLTNNRLAAMFAHGFLRINKNEISGLVEYLFNISCILLIYVFFAFQKGDHLSKETIGEHAQKEKNGPRVPTRNRGRGRRDKRGTNGHGNFPRTPLIFFLASPYSLEVNDICLNITRSWNYFFHLCG